MRSLPSLVLLALLYATRGSSQEVEPEEGFPETFVYMAAPQKFEARVLQQHVALKRLWDKGQTVRACFFGGDAPVRELIAKTAVDWEEPTGLIFDFGPSGQRRDCGNPDLGWSHIRVGFGSPGYWSFVGTDSVRLSNQFQPSMNYTNFDVIYSPFNGFTVDNIADTASARHKGTIRHEFGHALGFLHEHQNQNLNCWDELIKEGVNSVYNHYGRPPNNWSRSVVERNLGLAILSDPDSTSGESDPASNMMYEIPANILKGGTNSPCFVSKRSNTLSALDKQFASQMYLSASDMLSEDDIMSITHPGVVASSDSPALRDNYVAQIITDLNSSDTQFRREARERLAGYMLAVGGDGLEAIITDDLSSRSYREQLGIAVALASISDRLSLPSVIIDRVTALNSSVNDQTIKLYLKKTIDSSQR